MTLPCGLWHAGLICLCLDLCGGCVYFKIKRKAVWHLDDQMKRTVQSKPSHPYIGSGILGFLNVFGRDFPCCEGVPQVSKGVFSSSSGETCLSVLGQRNSQKYLVLPWTQMYPSEPLGLGILSDMHTGHFV